MRGSTLSGSPVPAAPSRKRSATPPAHSVFPLPHHDKNPTTHTGARRENGANHDHRLENHPARRARIRGEYFPLRVQPETEFKKNFHETGFWTDKRDVLLICNKEEKVVGAAFVENSRESRAGRSSITGRITTPRSIPFFARKRNYRGLIEIYDTTFILLVTR